MKLGGKEPVEAVVAVLGRGGKAGAPKIPAWVQAVGCRETELAEAADPTRRFA